LRDDLGIALLRARYDPPWTCYTVELDTVLRCVPGGDGGAPLKSFDPTRLVQEVQISEALSAEPPWHHDRRLGNRSVLLLNVAPNPVWPPWERWLPKVRGPA
jgi:hypothetical protein